MPQDEREPDHDLPLEEGLWRADVLRGQQVETILGGACALRRLVSDLNLDKETLTEVIREKDLAPTVCREMIGFVKTGYPSGGRAGRCPGRALPAISH